MEPSTVRGSEQIGVGQIGQKMANMLPPAQREANRRSDHANRQGRRWRSEDGLVSRPRGDSTARLTRHRATQPRRSRNAT